jgi:malonate transporter and related proteins
MSTTLLLLPDFAMILLGFLLHRSGRFTRPFWEGLERLIYYVLFPALLFQSLAKNRIELAVAGPAMLAAIGVVTTGIVLAWLGKWILRPDPRIFASGVQTAFRFNSYIGLAVASRLYGDEGLAAFAILVAVAVPLANVASVWALARHAESNFLKELAQNPLLLATAAGVAWSFTGWVIPEPISVTLTRMGAASLAAGLLAVGAALTLESAGRHVPIIAWFLTVKMLALPVAAWLLASALGMSGVYYHVLIMFGALPTATSAYVLAVRMGGDGKSVALIISLSTLIGMITLPIAVALLAR